MASQAAGKQHITTALTASDVYATAQIHNLWMGATDSGIHLFQGRIVENDSPGAGRSDDEGRIPFVEISGPTVLRKVFYLEDPGAEGGRPIG